MYCIFMLGLRLEQRPGAQVQRASRVTVTRWHPAQAEPGPLEEEVEEEEEEAGLRVWAVGAEKTKLELVPAPGPETEAAGPPDPPDFWANRVPESDRNYILLLCCTPGHLVYHV